MTVANVLVVGAAGQTGKHILKALLQEKEAKWAVKACIFSDGREEQEKALSKFEGLDVVTLEAHNVDKLAEAMKEADEIVIVPPATADKFTIMKSCIQASRKAKVGFVLLVSMYGADEPDFLFGQQFKDIEEAIKSEADFKSYCIIRPQFYVQNLLLLKDMVKKGQLPVPIGSGKFAPIDADDMGLAVCKILKEPSKHQGKCYNLTGPVAMSTEEMAKKLSELVGQEVKASDDTATAKAHLKQSIPATELLGVLELYQVIAAGKLNQCTEDAEKLLGTKWTTFEQWAKEHVDFFK